jgi:hypothetical protein
MQKNVNTYPPKTKKDRPKKKEEKKPLDQLTPLL